MSPTICPPHGSASSLTSDQARIAHHNLDSCFYFDFYFGYDPSYRCSDLPFYRRTYPRVVCPRTVCRLANHFVVGSH